MKNLVRPASILMYVLSLIVFLFVGISFAGLTGAAENQGLAGGAIVIGYGIIAAGTALVCAIVLAFLATRRTVVNVNRVLAIALVAFVSFFAWRYCTREQDRGIMDTNRPVEPTPKPVQKAAPLAISLQEDTAPMGLGFFQPDIFDKQSLYFYGNLNPDKPVQDHMPYDSLSFGPKESGGYDITYAPPWLYPDILKMDYDMLAFRVLSIGRDFIEIVVNRKTMRTTYVDRRSGRLQYWPEFLLGINSVEFIEPAKQKVYFKPLTHSALITVDYAFMRPVFVRKDWMKVTLLSDDFRKTGEGWIRWTDGTRLLITYSLLS